MRPPQGKLFGAGWRSWAEADQHRAELPRRSRPAVKVLRIKGPVKDATLAVNSSDLLGGSFFPIVSLPGSLQ